ncbi:MAG: ferrochelatase [Helicobacteraceae bacterium]|nr:ferrochelatase [Helicobacteraceae bacterium]
MSDYGIALLNMGGAANEEEVSIFLKNMFRDRHILRIGSRPLRYLLAWLIASKRKSKALSHYAMIGDRSPILSHSRSLAKKLSAIAGARVFIAMRYAPPFTSEAVAEVKKSGVKRLVLLPLYPQYSTATTLSSLECFYSEMKKIAFSLPISRVDRFYDHPTYNAAIIDEIKKVLGAKNASEFALVFSAHGLPQSVVDKGDPYQTECEAHARILTKRLTLENLSFDETVLAYQSKVGPLKWITPSLEQTINELYRKGHRKLLIVPLSFPIDNLETDYELAIDYFNRAKKIGYEEFLVARCPNDSDRFATALSELALSALIAG